MIEYTHQCGNFCRVKGNVLSGTAYCCGVKMVPFYKELQKMKELIKKTPQNA